MGSLLKTVGFTSLNYPLIKRSQGVLSDGTSVSMVLDMNQAAITGSGGDATGVPKIYIYTSPDRVTWTLKATINFPAATSARTMASMVVDVNNNVNVVFRAGDGSIRFCPLTYSAGPTYSVGALVTILAIPGANITYQRVDVDQVGSGVSNTVCAVIAYNSATLTNYVISVMRIGGGTWLTHASVTLNTAGRGVGLWTEDITVAGSRTGTTADQCYVVTATRKGATTDSGDIIYLTKVSTTTGLVVGSVQTIASGINVGRGAGFRSYWNFYTGVNEFTIAGTVSADPWLMFVYRFTWNGTTLTKTVTVPTSVSQPHGTLTRTPYVYGWSAVAYAGSGKIVFFGKNSESSYATVATISGAAATWQPSIQLWDNRYQYNNVIPVSYISSGASTNFTAAAITVLLFFEKLGASNAYTIQHRSHVLPLAPVRVLPASGGLVATDRPALSADFKAGLQYSQARMKMEWQFATDAGFTTNVRTVLEADADYKVAYDTTSPTFAVVSAKETTTSAAELYQGVWYLRARTLDEMGSYGPYSAASAFTVAHPPSATNLLPPTDKMVFYGVGGNITFSWTFSDSSSTDVQTAYQIVIENADTGSTVLDTGQVVSTAQNSTQVIPIGSKDVSLRWKMRVWDSDNVAGAYTDYRVFIITDPPAPTIVSPTGVISTAIPLVSWTSGVGVVKTQDRYKVTLWQSGKQLYTTGWVKSTDATSYQMPLGYIDNLQNYTVTVTIRDNFGLEGTGTSLISTVWIVPSSPQYGWKVWTYEYDRRGFIYVSWDAALRDTDFTAWNVYRRKVGELTWTFLESLTAADDFMAYRDYTAAAETTYQYAVTQVVNRFGDIVESAIGPLDNLVQNPGFEDGTTTGWATSGGAWVIASTSIAVVTHVSDPTADTAGVGANALYCAVPASTYRGCAYVINGDFEPNTEYVATALVKRQSGPPVSLLLVDVTNAIVIYAGYTSSLAYIRQVSRMTTGPLRSTQLMVGFRTDGTGTSGGFRIDDVTLRRSIDPATLVQVTPASESYWLLDQLNQDLSMPLPLVTADAFTDEYEEEEYTIIGRGRHVDIGDRIGYDGGLTVQLRNKFTSGVAKYNFIVNSSMRYQSNLDGNPDAWAVSSSGDATGVSYGYVETETPSPSGFTPHQIQADSMSGSILSSLVYTQTLIGATLPAALQVAGTSFAFTSWVFQDWAVNENTNREHKLQVIFYDSAGTVLQTTDSGNLDINTASIEQHISVGLDSPANPTNQWKRLQATGTVPAGTIARIAAKIMLVGDGTSNVRTNLIANPSFEVDVANWSSSISNTSLVRDVSTAAAGTACLLLTVTAQDGVANYRLKSADMPVTEGVSYTAQCKIKMATATGRAIRVYIIWKNAAGSTVTSTAGGFATNPTPVTGSFLQCSVTGVAPATAVTANMFIRNNDTSVVLGDAWYVDACVFEESTGPGSYFEGTVGAVNLVTNPSFETNTTGWTNVYPSSTTMVRSTADAWIGAASLLVTTLAAGGGGNLPGTVKADVAFAQPLAVYTASARFKIAPGSTVRSGPVFVQLTFLDAASVQIGSSFTSTVTTVYDSGWTTVSVTAAAPALTVYVELLTRFSNPVLGLAMYVDGVLLEEDNAVSEYFEGMGTDTLTSAKLTLGGSQLETGSATPYFDGDQIEGEWDAVPGASWSLTTGYYTARKQRLALEEMKARKTSMYLRNPFGDIWVVMPGNIQITRIAGTGKAEFSDAEIPYREVGF